MLTSEQIKPTKTETRLQEKKLNEIEFPVVFKICFKNSIDIEKLKMAGYRTDRQYFRGQSWFNKSIYGWAGHVQGGHTGPGVKGREIFEFM